MGTPEVVRGDNGIQYSSRRFAESWRFQHITSSREYPRCNGTAERYVQVIKNMLTKAKDSGQDPYLVMLEARNIPVDGLATLAQLMCGRTLRSVLPCKQEKLKIKARTDDESYIEQRQKNQENQAKYYDQHSRPLKGLHIGEKVSMLDSKTWKPAVVIKRCEEPRSFIVKTENGKTFRRNCHHLHQIAHSIGIDETILISDAEEENSVAQVIVKCEEVEMDPSNKVNVPRPDNLSNEVTK